VQTGGFSGASTTPIQSDRATQVVAAGFGDAGTAPSTGARRAVAPGGGFGDTVAAAPAAGGSRQKAPASQTAAEILEKPRPAYTEEARRLRIEGEVQL